MSFLDAAIGSIGQGLAQTAVDALTQETGVDVGGALGFLFAGDQSMGGQDMESLSEEVANKFADNKKMLDQLQGTLDQQGKKLDALGAQLTSIAKEVAYILGKIDNIEHLLTEIKQEQLYQDWQSVDNEFTKYIAAIDTAFRTYGNYMSLYKTTPAEEVKQLIKDILNTNDGPAVGLKAIHDFIMRSDGHERNALQLWSQMVTPLVEQGMLDYRLGVQQYIEYYQKLTYAQLRAVNLVMEAQNFYGNSKQAQREWDQYKEQLVQQEDTFITWLIPLVYAGIVGGFVEVNKEGGPNYTAHHAALQMNPGVQRVRGDDGSIYDAYYAPSDLFAMAEQLLANLAVTSAADRRIVVHMWYTRAFASLLDACKLTLTQAGKTILPTSSKRLGPYQFPPRGVSLDYNFFIQYDGQPQEFYVRRFVFKSGDPDGLSDGAYTLTNLNGRDGLVALHTYMDDWIRQSDTPFQADNVVSHSMTVNAASPFDFMNFLAYSAPSLLPRGRG